MKKIVVFGFLITTIMGVFFASYYSITIDDISKLDWVGTTYLSNGHWGNIVGHNNLFDVDVTVTNTEGNPGDVLICISNHKGESVGDDVLLAVGETITLFNIPSDSGTYTIQAKASIEGPYTFETISEKSVN